MSASNAVRAGRWAGVLYLLSAIAAGVPVLYTANVLVVDGSSTATASSIVASEMVYRWCIVSELGGAVLLIFLVHALYSIFRDVDQPKAALMVMLAVLSVPISFVNVMSEVAALELFRGTDVLTMTTQPERNALAMLLLDLHATGISLANVFWALWLFPFGILILRSQIVPRILGALLIADGMALLTVSITALLWPVYLDTVNKIAALPEFGELLVMGWLIVKGCKQSVGPRQNLAQVTAS